MAVAATQGSTRMRLFFKAKGLADLDTFSKSDPYVVVHHVPEGAGARPVFAGKTETIMNDLNPVWQTPVEVDFHFEAKQDFAFTVFDDDGKGPNGDDVAAKGTFQLAHVVAGRGSTLEVKLSKGVLWISAEEAATSGRDTVSLSFAGHKLKKMDLIGQSDPYFKIYRMLPNGQRKLLFQSKVIKETLDPKWQPTSALLMSDLTAGADLSTRCLQIECWDEDLFSDDKMGQFHISIGELMDAAARYQQGDTQYFKLVHEKKADKFYGDFYVPRAVTTHFPTFPEFLGAGLQVNLAVSIDFTGSNGDPRNSNSLHFMSPTMPNQYVRAIMSVGEILMEYDSDKMVPAFGFGAVLPSNPAVANHCFHLNGQPDPHVHGVQGILDTYAHALKNVRLSGPTNFAPTILQATHAARSSPGAYTILLILTDGCITDTDATIDAIVAAGDAPLSIIIVGVGNANFSTMDVLDGDEERLRDRRGRPAARDLVQFVPFRDFERRPPSALAAEVLREVPQQVLEWAQINHITPQHFGSTATAGKQQQQQQQQ